MENEYADAVETLTHEGNQKKTRKIVKTLPTKCGESKIDDEYKK